ncbi:MAG: 50S ribosomal protein L37Ae [Promethearchaeota archaeon]|nr:MAG: 50S ribosomal protein L37Ae [Candidatus Lokiarchaeota archaeon]
MGKTKKVSITGRYGARYGSVNRKRTREVLDRMKPKSLGCPKCRTKGSVHRISIGIWYCRKCDAKFTGGAYSIATARGLESFRVSKRKQREIELIEEEE